MAWPVCCAVCLPVPGVPVVGSHGRFFSVRECGRVDVGGGAGAGGGFPALPGQVAGDVEQVVIQGGGGAPVPGDGAFAGGGGRGALGAGAGGGAFVPPGVVDGDDGVAQPGADGAGVAADELCGWSRGGRRRRGRCGPSRGP